LFALEAPSLSPSFPLPRAFPAAVLRRNDRRPQLSPAASAPPLRPASSPAVDAAQTDLCLHLQTASACRTGLRIRNRKLDRQWVIPQSPPQPTQSPARPTPLPAPPPPHQRKIRQK